MKRLVISLVIVAVVLCATAVSAQYYLHWRQSNPDGFGDVNNVASVWFSDLGGYLYMGTTNLATGGEMWRSPSGYEWFKSGDDGFGNPNNIAIAAGARYGGVLYAGTRNTVTGGQVWRTSDAIVWTQVATGGFGDINNVFVLPIFKPNLLFATTFNSVTGCEVWRSSDGNSWTQVNADGFGDVNNREAYGLKLFFGTYMYVGTRNDVTGGEIWRSSDGTTWTQVNIDGFGDVNNRDVYPVYANATYIYAGTRNVATGGEIWRSSDGTTWTQVNVDGFGDPNNITAIAGGEIGGNLYAGTENLVTGGEVWKSPDGTTWTQANVDGFGDANNVKADRVIAFEGNIYSGTENSVTGMEIWQGTEYLETTVYAVQQETYPTETNVRCDSLICTAVDHKPNTFGFFGQELGGGPWSGVLCYSYGDRPDLVYNIEVGDLFTVIGEYQEYPEVGSQVTEISVDDAWLITKDYGLPTPVLLSCDDLTMVPVEPPDTLTERWEGVYMCVDTVQVTEHRTFDEWNVSEYHAHPGFGGDDSLIIDDKLVDPTLSRPGVLDSLLKVTGVFSEEYGSYKLWPRGLDDLEYMGPPPGPNVLQAYATSDTSVRIIFDRAIEETSAENTDNYFLESETTINEAVLEFTKIHVVLITDPQPDNTLDKLTVCDIESEFGSAMDSCMTYSYMAGITDIWYVQEATTDTTQAPDASQILGEQVTLSGEVTSSSNDFGGPFYMRDATGRRNGIYIYWPAGDVTVGDQITVSGLVDEYNNMTEIISVDYVDELSTGGLPIPDLVPMGELAIGADSAESWEGCFVRVDTTECLSMRNPDTGEWTHGLGSDVVDVGAFGEYIHPGFGSTIDITGCYAYSFGNFRMEPRDTADIVVLVPCTAGIEDVKEETGAQLRLYQNAPNPFAAGTVIRFAVPSQMRARIAVYDVQGREVNVLTDSVMEPGNHMVQWDGKDRHGRQVSSGIYFYRFVTPNAVMHKKMVMLK